MTAVDSLSAKQSLMPSLCILQSREHSSMKSVHRSSLSNSRPYNTVVLYKCALESDDYDDPSRHSLHIGSLLTHGFCILVVISATKTRGRLICGSTYMRVYTVLGYVNSFLCIRPLFKDYTIL